MGHWCLFENKTQYLVLTKQVPLLDSQNLSW